VGLWLDSQYDTIRTTFCPGDRLMLYSDGVTECANRGGELFGEERLLAYLSATGAEPLPSMLAGLEREMEQWRGQVDFDDDVSLLALEFTEVTQEQT
jgi:sigma-B regulation protein RsbU (phosphoserine phosphatase)